MSERNRLHRRHQEYSRETETLLNETNTFCTSASSVLRALDEVAKVYPRCVASFAGNGNYSLCRKLKGSISWMRRPRRYRGIYSTKIMSIAHRCVETSMNFCVFYLTLSSATFQVSEKLASAMDSVNLLAEEEHQHTWPSSIYSDGELSSCYSRFASMCETAASTSGCAPGRMYTVQQLPQQQLSFGSVETSAKEALHATECIHAAAGSLNQASVSAVINAPSLTRLAAAVGLAQNAGTSETTRPRAEALVLRSTSILDDAAALLAEGV